MRNLLFLILELIDRNNWCFKYDGVCSTCGVENVKDELMKYDTNLILKSFENLDLHNKDVRTHLVKLDRLYSLFTGLYPVWDSQENLIQKKKLKILWTNKLNTFSIVLIKNDKNDRENGSRDVLLETFNNLSNYKKLVIMADDGNHTPKYYPGHFAYMTIQEDIDKLTPMQYSHLSSMFYARIESPSQWLGFKKRFIDVCE